MSNNLLHKEIRKNPIPLIGSDKVLTDELFGIVRLHIKDNELIWTTTYNQLNYLKVKETKSHHESHGTFFYYNSKKQRDIFIMLDHIKTVDIDMKHDNLRIALQED